MNIRQTDAIVHVVRCFVDDDIIHVDGNVDPLRDVEIISLELILADLAQIEKKLEKVPANLTTYCIILITTVAIYEWSIFYVVISMFLFSLCHLTLFPNSPRRTGNLTQRN